jgi:hypothetical protein
MESNLLAWVHADFVAQQNRADTKESKMRAGKYQF